MVAFREVAEPHRAVHFLPDKLRAKVFVERERAGEPRCPLGHYSQECTVASVISERLVATSHHI